MIIGCAIAPHGALILPDNLDPASESYRIHVSMEQLTQHVQELKPDIIFMSTPHGISLENNFGFYKNARATGTAEWLNEYKEYAVDLTLDVETTDKLLKKLQVNNKVDGITSYTGLEPIYLRWGEVIPAWFLRHISAKYIIMSQPSRRLHNAHEMIPDLDSLGKEMTDYFQSIKERVFILISGDMSHVYQADGPYGIHPSAEPFDKAVETWARTLERTHLTEKAASMINTALSCGFTGFVLVDSIIRSLNTKVKSEVLCNLHPTYYGMMVSIFSF